MSNLVLGLDLGPNSIGWALVNDDPANPSESRIVDLGVRVFPEGVDAFDTSKEVSRSEQRRIARGMRRQQRRRADRRRKLKHALVELELWPTDEAEQQALLDLDPYELRTKALDQRLSLHELGRVLLQINQRRGFRSNKKEQAKADAKAKKKSPERAAKAPSAEKKTEDMLLEMAELEKAIHDFGARTLGEYLFRKNAALNHRVRVDDDFVRGRHTQRKMLIDEFDRIWAKQASFHPELSEELRDGKVGRLKDIHKPIPKDCEFLDRQQIVKNPRYGMSDLEAFGVFGLIFFHRSLKPVPKEIVGLCELEKKARRCARANRCAQRFRLLQEVNNLRYIDPDIQEESSLDDGQRAMILEHLATREKATFDEIRNKLGFLESVKFNLERGKRASIQGMVTDWLMAKSLGKEWHEFPESTKDGIVDALITSIDDDETHEFIVQKFGLTTKQADTALTVDLPEGYLKLSLVAIKKLLPHMEHGLVYEHRESEKSARAAAGYDEPWALRNRLFDRLPDPRRTANSPIADIPNPVVKRALVELRKVVNAIMREYGRPDEIHVEMGRDVKSRPKKDPKNPAYRRYLDQIADMREREAKRDEAKKQLRENNQAFGSQGINILKYLLWKEQDEVCVYSGRSIGFSKLFTDEVEIDHILPYSQSLEDSQMNKVICFHSENRGSTGKGQKTPRGWLEHSNLAKYQEVCQRAKKLPYLKYKRFLQKNVDIDGFIDRQLNDNRYIAKATVEYLKCLFELEDNKRGAVLGLKGQLTSELRWQWGLETVIEELPDSPAWHEANNLRTGEKNRADHRHHAIDAVVLALTNRSRLQQLSRLVKAGGARKHGEILPEPWDNFRDDVLDRIKHVNVSHRVERKVAGELHEGTYYGSTSCPGEGVYRKLLVDLSLDEIDAIRDKTVRSLVKAELASAGASTQQRIKEVLSAFTLPSGVPVYKVRIVKQDKTLQLLREGAYVKPGSTHHIAIFEWEEQGETVRDGVFVTRLDGNKRLKNHESIIHRVHPLRPDARFLMSLAVGELVLMQIDGRFRLARMRTSKSTEKRLKFCLAEDARKKYREINVTVNTLFSKYAARKVTVDPLGRIRWAND